MNFIYFGTFVRDVFGALTTFYIVNANYFGMLFGALMIYLIIHRVILCQKC